MFFDLLLLGGISPKWVVALLSLDWSLCICMKVLRYPIVDCDCMPLFGGIPDITMLDYFPNLFSPWP